MNPFRQYRHINAEDIVKANIRPGHIGEDINTLLPVLLPVTYIAKPDPQATNLHRQVIQKLSSKPNTLNLLNCFGYKLNEQGEYSYQSTNSDDELTKRRNAANEFHLFYNDLKKIKEGSLDGFEEYINSVSSRPQSRIEPNEDFSRPSSSSYPSFRSISPPSQMPDHLTVTKKNAETSEKVREFKQKIIPSTGGRPAHSFIRRKLLFLLFTQKYPDAISFGANEVDQGIDLRIRDLKKEDKNPNGDISDEIYYECLIRANFEANRAIDILNNHRPNLKPPPEPEIQRGPTTTTIDNSIQCLRQQNQLLDQSGAGQVLVQEGDEWKNTTYIVTAIVQLRARYNDQAVDQMYRLLSSELKRVVGIQSILKIEILASVLCEVPADSLDNLTIADIRDVLRAYSDHDIPDNYRDSLLKCLSTECPACGGNFPRSQMEKLFSCDNDDHTCCLDCTKRYFRITVKEIRDTKSLRQLTCCIEQHEIADDANIFFPILGTKLNQWFHDEKLVLDTYNENLFIATRDSQVKKCGNSKCLGFFDNNNNDRPARAQCPHCKFQQCRLCCRKWHNEHSKLTCEEYIDWLRDNDPDDPEVQLTKYLNTAGMVCPNAKCKAIYEYQPGGCEHFTCPTCKTEFCRICSALFYNPKHNTICPRPTCGLKSSLHAHCYMNCFREIRDASTDEIIELLNANKINAIAELREKPAATGIVCPVDGCKNALSAASENRFCDVCYKQFLCLLVWRNQIEPWVLYTDNNLRQKLKNASINAPANADKPALIALAKQHLQQYLGKPIPIPRIRQS